MIVCLFKVMLFISITKPSDLILIAIITYEINVKTIFETKIND